MTRLEIALSYLEKGFSVIPLYSPEMLKSKHQRKFMAELNKEYEKNNQLEEPLPKDVVTERVLTRWCKRPCIFDWKQYQGRLPTKEEVTQWFNTNPTPNIAIITGAISGIVVFDLDSQHAIEYADEQGGFPDTVKAKTGKGYHIYMKHPGTDIRNTVNKNLDIDIRADGGYVVAPPSQHGSGHYYGWEEGFSISQIDPAPCTPWMRDYLDDISRSEALENAKHADLFHDLEETIRVDEKMLQAAANSNTQEPKVQEIKKDEYLDLMQNGCKQGERNHSATRLIGHLLKSGMKETEIWEVLQMWNSDKVKPPLDVNELKKTFESLKALEKKTQTTPTQAPKVNVDSFLDDINVAVSEYQQHYVRVPFANSNLINLEKNMNGGFAGGRFYLFGGIPSSGKTVLLNNIADNICLNGYPVLFFSYDDPRAELRYRTFSRFSRKSIEDFNYRTLPDIRDIWQLPSIQQIVGKKYIVQNIIILEKWNELISQIKQKHEKPPVIIIDYLRKLRTEKSSGDERLRVDDILSKLTEMAKTHNIPIIAISELARDSYKSGQRLSMASFKESGTIEYEASWLGILGPVEEKGDGEFEVKEGWDSIIKHDGNVDLIIFKAKRGTGETGKVPLKVDRKFMTVSDRPSELATEKKKKKSQFE
ncbi:MAG: bifunctional DNA primase/polymerase [Syntrophorhabdaceae bacterium]|nr:bifunctional DNA primase/polymerase [Syntrophorhabdaceae bacterium]